MGGDPGNGGGKAPEGAHLVDVASPFGGGDGVVEGAAPEEVQGTFGGRQGFTLLLTVDHSAPRRSRMAVR